MNSESLAPIVIFCYKRPVELKKLLDSLSRNGLVDKSTVYFFQDGIKHSIDEGAVREVSEIIADCRIFKSKIIRIADANIGLAKSVRAGLDEVFQNHEKVIVLEDDLIVGQTFLEFMNRALVYFNEHKDVSGISGYSYPFLNPEDNSYFLKGADCWGWGTWIDRWQLANFNVSWLQAEIKIRNRVDEFNLQGKFNYFGMLKDLQLGFIDSWAICWHASMFLQDRLMYYPEKALVSNTGSSMTATHPQPNGAFENFLDNHYKFNFEGEIKHSLQAQKKLGDLLQEIFPKMTFQNHIALRTRRYFPGLYKFIRKQNFL